MKKGRWFIWTVLVVLILYLFHPIVLRRLFPIKYQAEIKKYSREYELDPYLVAAVIRVESNYDPYAQSHKNAMGLMQIIPSTGLWAAEELNLTKFYIEELYVADTNIKIGTWYLQKLNNQFGGNIRLVLAAYNGGSGNVSKWLLDKRYSANGEELDYIPFPETRNYVDKVLFYRDLYRRIYGLN